MTALDQAVRAAMEAWDAETRPVLHSAETAAARLANLGRPDEEADILVSRARTDFEAAVRKGLADALAPSPASPSVDTRLRAAVAVVRSAEAYIGDVAARVNQDSRFADLKRATAAAVAALDASPLPASPDLVSAAEWLDAHGGAVFDVHFAGGWLWVADASRDLSGTAPSLAAAILAAATSLGWRGAK